MKYIPCANWLFFICIIYILFSRISKPIWLSDMERSHGVSQWSIFLVVTSRLINIIHLLVILASYLCEWMFQGPLLCQSKRHQQTLSKRQVMATVHRMGLRVHNKKTLASLPQCCIVTDLYHIVGWPDGDLCHTFKCRTMGHCNFVFWKSFASEIYGDESQ